METTVRQSITVESSIMAPAATIWESWNEPKHITKWAAASDDWHTTYAENDIRTGGRFLSRMAAKDGSFSFDFSGTYEEVKPGELIRYVMDDGRKVVVNFDRSGNNTKITETFEAEDTNPIEMQKGGWQAILDNFKKYTESLAAN